MTAKRVYVSTFPVDSAFVSADPRYRVPSREDAMLFTPSPSDSNASFAAAFPCAALDVTRLLRSRGIEYVWFRDFWDYPAIEDVIAQCSSMLAVVDTYYFSSTGKAIELTYAAGRLAHTRSPIKPIPIFVLPLDDSYTNYTGLQGAGPWNILEQDPEEAVSRIVAALSNREDR